MWAPPAKEAFTCIQGVTQPDNNCLGKLEPATNGAGLAPEVVTGGRGEEWQPEEILTGKS